MEGQTGARDETYDVVAVLYHALKGAGNCRKYIQDAPNDELRQFFEQAQQVQRGLAEQAKQCLHRQLMQGGEDQSQGQSSAFGFGQDSESNENFTPAGK